MNNYQVRANLSAFMAVLSLVVMFGIITFIPESFPLVCLGVMAGDALAVIAHRILFPHRWREVDGT